MAGIEIPVASLNTTMPLFKLCINENGKVENVFVLRSSGIEQLDRRVCEGFCGMRFRPPTVNGKPARSSVYVTHHIYI
jgi:TonB family protein